MENNFLFDLGDKTKDQGCCQEPTNHEQSWKKLPKKIVDFEDLADPRSRPNFCGGQRDLFHIINHN